MYERVCDVLLADELLADTLLMHVFWNTVQSEQCI